MRLQATYRPSCLANRHGSPRLRPAICIGALLVKLVLIHGCPLTLGPGKPTGHHSPEPTGSFGDCPFARPTSVSGGKVEKLAHEAVLVYLRSHTTNIDTHSHDSYLVCPLALPACLPACPCCTVQEQCFFPPAQTSSTNSPNGQSKPSSPPRILIHHTHQSRARLSNTPCRPLHPNQARTYVCAWLVKRRCTYGSASVVHLLSVQGPAAAALPGSGTEAHMAPPTAPPVLNFPAAPAALRYGAATAGLTSQRHGDGALCC